MLSTGKKSDQIPRKRRITYFSKADESDAFLRCPCSTTVVGLFGGGNRLAPTTGVGSKAIEFPFGLCLGVTLVSSGVMLGVTEADLIGLSSALVLAVRVSLIAPTSSSIEGGGSLPFTFLTGLGTPSK